MIGTPFTNTKKPNKQAITFMIDLDQAEAFRALAAKRRTSLAALAREAFDLYLARVDARSEQLDA